MAIYPEAWLARWFFLNPRAFMPSRMHSSTTNPKAFVCHPQTTHNALLKMKPQKAIMR